MSIDLAAERAASEARRFPGAAPNVTLPEGVVVEPKRRGRPPKNRGASPPAVVHSAPDLIKYESGRGSFLARPMPDGSWAVAQIVMVDRATALNLAGQAWSHIFPGVR